MYPFSCHDQASWRFSTDLKAQFILTTLPLPTLNPGTYRRWEVTESKTKAKFSKILYLPMVRTNTRSVRQQPKHATPCICPVRSHDVWTPGPLMLYLQRRVKPTDHTVWMDQFFHPMPGMCVSPFPLGGHSSDGSSPGPNKSKAPL